MTEEREEEEEEEIEEGEIEEREEEEEEEEEEGEVDGQYDIQQDEGEAGFHLIVHTEDEQAIGLPENEASYVGNSKQNILLLFRM